MSEQSAEEQGRAEARAEFIMEMRAELVSAWKEAEMARIKLEHMAKTEYRAAATGYIHGLHVAAKFLGDTSKYDQILEPSALYGKDVGDIDMEKFTKAKDRLRGVVDMWRGKALEK